MIGSFWGGGYQKNEFLCLNSTKKGDDVMNLFALERTNNEDVFIVFEIYIYYIKLLFAYSLISTSLVFL